MKDMKTKKCKNSEEDLFFNCISCWCDQPKAVEYFLRFVIFVGQFANFIECFLLSPEKYP